MNKIKKIFIIALIDAITAQIFINMFSGNFRISLAVAILPVFYYFNRELNPIITAIVITMFGFLFRSIINVGNLAYDFSLISQYFYIVFFDLTYGIIFYWFYYKRENKEMFNWAFVVFFGDFFSNLIEIISRGIFVSAHINELIIVAFIRTVLASFILLLVLYYKTVWQDKIDRKRYNQLVEIFSNIKSEVYLMNTNTNYIEEVMSEAYDLYNTIEYKSLRENKNKALKIAQNVHEIKKNYLGILRGLEKITFKEKKFSTMSFHELLKILEKNIEDRLEKKGLSIRMKIERGKNFSVSEDYYMLSILRNLMNNAIDAVCDKEEDFLGKILLSYSVLGDKLKIEIFDNGIGIHDKNIDYIFNSGFSSKFSQNGDINRGLGLTLVKQLVEEKFNGEIQVISKYRHFTKVIISLDLKRVTGENK